MKKLLTLLNQITLCAMMTLSLTGLVAMPVAHATDHPGYNYGGGAGPIPPDRDGDGQPDTVDPCPYDSSNSCFEACMQLQLSPSFGEAVACAAVGGAVMVLVAALTGGTGVLATYGLGAAMAQGAIVGAYGAIAASACACIFQMFG